MTGNQTCVYQNLVNKPRPEGSANPSRSISDSFFHDIDQSKI